MSYFYILDEAGDPVVCDDLVAWSEFMAGADRKVAEAILDGYHISTVFLGVNHSFDKGAPILFETMIYWDAGGQRDPIWLSGAWRYATIDQAIAGHAEITQQLYKQLQEKGAINAYPISRQLSG